MNKQEIIWESIIIHENHETQQQYLKVNKNQWKSQTDLWQIMKIVKTFENKLKRYKINEQYWKQWNP